MVLWCIMAGFAVLMFLAFVLDLHRVSKGNWTDAHFLIPEADDAETSRELQSDLNTSAAKFTIVCFFIRGPGFLILVSVTATVFYSRE